MVIMLIGCHYGQKIDFYRLMYFLCYICYINMYGRRYSKSRKSYNPRRFGKKSPRPLQKYKPRRFYRKVAPFRTIWKNPLPLKAYFKFRYSDSGFAATTVGPLYRTQYAFRGNSVYDPDATGVGVQPYGYDTYCDGNSPFGRYTVLSSKIKIYPHVNATPDNIRAVRWIVVPSRLIQPSFREFEDLKQMQGARSLVVNSVDDQRGHLSSYMSTRRIFGEFTSLQSIQSASYNTDPSTQWYWYVQIDSIDSAKDVIQTFDVQITYYCIVAKNDSVDES